MSNQWIRSAWGFGRRVALRRIGWTMPSAGLVPITSLGSGTGRVHYLYYPGPLPNLDFSDYFLLGKGTQSEPSLVSNMDYEFSKTNSYVTGRISSHMDFHYTYDPFRRMDWFNSEENVRMYERHREEIERRFGQFWAFTDQDDLLLFTLEDSFQGIRMSFYQEVWRWIWESFRHKTLDRHLRLFLTIADASVEKSSVHLRTAESEFLTAMRQYGFSRLTRKKRLQILEHFKITDLHPNYGRNEEDEVKHETFKREY